MRLHAGPYRLHAVRWRGVRWFALDETRQAWGGPARTPRGAVWQAFRAPGLEVGVAKNRCRATQIGVLIAAIVGAAVRESEDNSTQAEAPDNSDETGGLLDLHPIRPNRRERP